MNNKLLASANSFMLRRNVIECLLRRVLGVFTAVNACLVPEEARLMRGRGNYIFLARADQEVFT